MDTEDDPRESDAYPAGTVAACEDDTDPADAEDASPVRQWDPILRGYVPANGEWPQPKRRSHIRSSARCGRAVPCGIDPRVATDDDCDAEEEEGGEDDATHT